MNCGLVCGLCIRLFDINFQHLRLMNCNRWILSCEHCWACICVTEPEHNRNFERSCWKKRDRVHTEIKCENRAPTVNTLTNSVEKELGRERERVAALGENRMNKKNGEKPLCWIRHWVINWITTHSRIINIFLVLSFRPLRFFSLTLSLFAATFAIQLQKWNFGYGRCRRLSMLSPLILVLLCRCSLTYCTQHSHCGLRRVFFPLSSFCQ